MPENISDEALECARLSIFYALHTLKGVQWEIVNLFD
jgi:hypothetical protein